MRDSEPEATVVQAQQRSKEKKAKKEKKEKKRKRASEDAAEGAGQAAGALQQGPAPVMAAPAAGGGSDLLEAAAAEEQPQPAAGSHAPDAATAQHRQHQEQQQGGTVAAAGDGEEQPAPATAAAAKAAQPGGKPAPVLPWMRVPIAIEASDGILLEEVQGLDPRLKVALEGSGIEVLFPVQTVVWHETAGGSSAAHDVCICAPTGSGKTLSYALPVLQALAGRAVPRLRALAVLPTRDLAVQVFNVLSTLCPALGLTACLACGKASLAAEAELLTAGNIDILVATPGRLIAHLEGTPGFSLAHLRFLVVDETDRLLRQAYQDWLPKVMAALQRQAPEQQQQRQQAPEQQQQQALEQQAPEQQQQQQQQQAPEQQQQARQRRVVKFVVSATLTRDPSKIDRLALHCPRYIAMSAVDHRYKLPRQLSELKLVVPAERKPAALAALLQELRGEQTIVFTSSVEATHRLYLLLAALSCLPDRVVEYSSTVAPAERAAALEAFRCGDAKVLVCSDAMTRGMDVAGVQNVVNYDAPVYVKTYVHRAGRTARAGRSGRVFTLLRHEDVRHFKDMLRKADNTFVKDHRLGKGALEAVRDDVDAALDSMAQRLLAEQQQQHEQQQAGAAAMEAAAGGSAAPAATAKPAAEAAGGAGGAGAPQPGGGAGKRAHKRRKVAGVPEFSLAELAAV